MYCFILLFKEFIVEYIATKLSQIASHSLSDITL